MRAHAPVAETGQRGPNVARTETVRQALSRISPSSAADLLFLEGWELDGQPAVWSTLRASQIRRANPELAAALRAEIVNAAQARRLGKTPL